MKQKHLAQYTSTELKEFAKEIVSWSRSKSEDPTKLILNDHLKRFIFTEMPSGNQFTRIVRLITLIKEEIFNRFVDDQFIDYVKPVNLTTAFENWKAHLDSPEGQKAIDDFVARHNNEAAILESQIKRFHDKYADKLDQVFERLMAKYESDQYVKREYSLGREPREPLYWFLFEYATKYGQECKDEKYINTFTGEIYYLGSYVIQVMHGQGSAIRIDKLQ